MRVFEGQRFLCFYDRDSGRTFEDLEFRQCIFESSAISITLDPQLRSTVRNVQLSGCEEIGCAVDAAIIEDVIVDGLRTSGVLPIRGAVFKHVTLKGKLGRILIDPNIAPGSATPEQQHAFDVANAQYYAGVDWALDISQAEFVEADIRSVPARLIRRDPETQVVVTRAKALEGRWRQVDLEDTYWDAYLDGMLWAEESDVVLVAPKRSRRFKQLLAGLQRLREAGVAEPD